MTPPSVTNFDYAAGNTDKRRYAPSARLKSSDQLLTPTKRKQLISSSRDLQQNFALCAWAIRKHLDYVSRFTFEPQTGDAGLDRMLEALVDWFSRPENCDVTGRHSLDRIIRLAEERRTVDGDVFLVKLRDGRLQALESDRIRNPDKLLGDDQWVQGIRVSRAGRPLRYGVWARDGSGGYDFERTVSARNVYQLGYFDRFDQMRGISLLAPAINTFRDLYEGFDYALAKLKVSQMFGLVLSRESAEGWSDISKDDAVTGGYQVDMGKGPIMLDLDPGDSADIIESKNPSDEFRHFTQEMIALALKSVDLPYSFYDTSSTNFFGSRSAFIHYEKACKSKRRDLQHLLDRITGWRMKMFIADGTLQLPAGMTLGDLRWSWLPEGTPWWNPMQEVNANIAAINAGLTSRSQVVREVHGKEFKDIVDQLAEEERYIADAGISIDMTGMPLEQIDEAIEVQRNDINLDEEEENND